VGAGTLRLGVIQLAAAAIGVGAIEIALMYSGVEVEPPWQVVLLPVLGWVYLAAGVAAWLRRPNNRVGALLTAGCFAWLAAGLNNVSTPALIAVGMITATLGLAVTVHLLHAFPSGRLRGRLSVWTVAAGYFVSTVLQAPAYLWGIGDGGPVGFLAIADRPDLARYGHWVQVAAGSLVMIATAFVLARRLASMSRSQRWVIGPLYAYAIFAVLWIPASADLELLALWDPLTRFQVQVATLAGVPIVFVAAMLRGGFARTGELEELGAWLGEEEGGRPALRDALADALGDPSLELAFWIGDAGHYADAAGRPVELPATGSERAAVEVERGGEQIGAIVYDAELIDDPALVRAAGRVVALALERERLLAALRASRERLRASRARIVEAADEERRRIARDLHDGLQSQLVLLAIKAHDLPDAGELHAGLQKAIADLRELVHGVMPPALAESGLYAAVEELAESVPMPIHLELDRSGEPLPPPVESAGYYVVSEALANALKHSQCRELRMRVARDNGSLRIEVGDDGVGGARPAAGAGLRGMAERIEALDGRLRVESSPGQGTLLVAELPCGS
jgi:signal transduction histidine kinase